MKVLFATTNPAKIKKYAEKLKERNIEVLTIKDLGINLKPEETGKNAIENAYIKAKTYYDATKITTIGMDNNLYIEELPEEKQPGTHVRRINGKELNDDEMIEYYAALARRHGGKITGQYRNAIFFVLDEQHCYSSMDESIFTEKFIMTAIPHPKRVEGFPMDSLSIDISTGKYYYDLDVKDVSTSVDDGVRKFFKQIFAGLHLVL